MILIEKMYSQMKKTDSFVCVGLDLIEELMPRELLKIIPNKKDLFFHFLSQVIDITASLSIGFKIQKAFFDQYEFGHHLLKQVIKYCRDNWPEKIIIIDCKIGDVTHTLEAYTKNLFDNMNSDGIVVNPYMGEEIFNLCDRLKDKLFFFLVRTSNPGNRIIQDVKLTNNKKLWEHILEMVCNRWENLKNCIPILSFEKDIDVEEIRNKIPEDMPIFWAGYGTQGKNIHSINNLLDKNGQGIIVNSSRGILYSNYKDHARWEDAIYNNIVAMRNELNSLNKKNE